MLKDHSAIIFDNVIISPGNLTTWRSRNLLMTLLLLDFSVLTIIKGLRCRVNDRLCPLDKSKYNLLKLIFTEYSYKHSVVYLLFMTLLCQPYAHCFKSTVVKINCRRKSEATKAR